MPDYAAIAELFARYGAANDLHSRELLASTLTAGATVTIHIAGTDSIGPLDGRDTIVSFFGDILDSQTDQRRHVDHQLPPARGRPRQRLPDADRHRRAARPSSRARASTRPPSPRRTAS